MKIQFLSAAGEVTGSRHSVQATVGERELRFMVDFGMFQGGREASVKNLESLPFSLKELEFVVLTHAHIDHSGLYQDCAPKALRGRSITPRLHLSY